MLFQNNIFKNGTGLNNKTFRKKKFFNKKKKSKIKKIYLPKIPHFPSISIFLENSKCGFYFFIFSYKGSKG